MAVAIDTNVLVDLFGAEVEAADRARRSLEAAGAREALVVSPVVYAELMAFPGRSTSVDDALAIAGVSVLWEILPSAWKEAALAYQRYALRRLRSAGGPPRRLLADFAIGAQALEVGALITLDPEFYRTNFPSLRLITPA